MLYPCFNEATLSNHLIGMDAFHPYPTMDDREAWQSLSADLRERFVQRGVETLNTPWPLLPASLYLEYARNGNRSRYEALYFQRRNRLVHLTLAECVENQGRFLDAITDGIWLICEETSWSLPAHINRQPSGKGLPDGNTNVVDLFAAETGGMLAWIHELLQSHLDSVSPLVQPRVAQLIKERIIEPAYNGDHGWTGFFGGPPNNWNPWICSNWLSCLLLLEPDPRLRRNGVSRIMRILDNFIAGYPADGGCDEGPGYWGRAAASLFDCLDLLHKATDGVIDVFSEPLIKNMGTYIYRAQLGGPWVLNFADSGARAGQRGPLVYRFGKAIGDEAMMRYAVPTPELWQKHLDDTCLVRLLPALWTHPEISTDEANDPLPRDSWWDGRQMMVARDRSGSTDGFCLAAKGGHNAESHNHNDVGQFMVYHDGKPILVDIGVEAYTAKTFSPERYTLWSMQSGWHNLPTINGHMQQAGLERAASDVLYEADNDKTTFSLDIAGAYPVEAGVEHWIRTVALLRSREVEITDEPVFTTAPSELFFSLITPCAVSVEEGIIRFSERDLPSNARAGCATLFYDPSRIAVEVEAREVTDAWLTRSWGDVMSRILLRSTAPGSTEPYVLRITQ